MTLVHIIWTDACFTNVLDPREANEIDGLSAMQTAGLLVKEDQKSITVALDHSITMNHFRGTLTIPRVNITSIQRFETDS